MALLYIDHIEIVTDLKIILLTVVGLISRAVALRGVQNLLKQWGADDLLREMARRETPLLPYPPPGATDIVTTYPVFKLHSTK